MYRLSIFAIVLLVVLTACTAQPRVLDATEHRVYLPAVTKPGDPDLGLETEDTPAYLVADYYLGEFWSFSVNAHVLERDGIAYVDAKIMPDTPLFVKLKGAYSYMVDPICAPIPREHWADWLRDFAYPVLDHIGPERIIFLELMNEPDTDTYQTADWLGCWGKDYAAGVYYAEFVNYAYPLLKQVAPHATILAGALMNAHQDFATGMIETLDTVDGISFHVYEHATGQRYLPGLLERLRNLTDLPLYLSETALICEVRTFICDQAQAEYYRELVALVAAGEIEMFVWYTLGGRCWVWLNSDMIEYYPLELKPVYQVYREEME